MANNTAINLIVNLAVSGFSIGGGTTDQRFLGISGDGDASFLTSQNIEVTLPDRATDTMLGWGDFLAKGDILVGTGAGTFAQLPVGENGQTLIVDDGEATGMLWGPLGGAGTITGNDGEPIIQDAANWNIIGLGETLTQKDGTGEMGIWSPRAFSAIVDATQYDGVYTDLQAAVDATSAGDVIFVRPGSYMIGTVTLPSTRIIVGSSPNQGTTQLVGQIRDNGVSMSIICHNVNIVSNDPGNVDFAVKLTGATSTLTTFDCFIQAWLHAAVGLTNAGNSWYSYNCQSNIQYLNGVLYSGAGVALHYGMQGGNGAGTNTPTGTTGGNVWRECNLSYPVGSSGSGFAAVRNSYIDLTGLGTATYCVTCAGSSSGYEVTNSTLKSGDQPAINVGAGTACSVSEVGIYSTNTNAISGSGTLNLGPVTMLGTSTQINVTTQVSHPTITAKFSPNAGTQTSNAYDGYEVGTFTPTITGASSAGTVTYVDRKATYMRVGKRVLVDMLMSITSMTGSGDVVLGGLPFNIKTGTAAYGTAILSGSWPWPASRTQVQAQIIPNTFTIKINCLGSAQSNAFLQCFNTAGVETIGYQIWYECE